MSALADLTVSTRHGGAFCDFFRCPSISLHHLVEQSGTTAEYREEKGEAMSLHTVACEAGLGSEAKGQSR